jgi:hypothetical protein
VWACSDTAHYASHISYLNGGPLGDKQHVSMEEGQLLFVVGEMPDSKSTPGVIGVVKVLQSGVSHYPCLNGPQ